MFFCVCNAPQVRCVQCFSVCEMLRIFCVFNTCLVCVHNAVNVLCVYHIWFNLFSALGNLLFLRTEIMKSIHKVTAMVRGENLCQI